MFPRTWWLPQGTTRPPFAIPNERYSPSHLDDAREHGQVPGVLAALLHQPVHVGRELVEEVVDDVGREDSHPVLVRVPARVAVDLHVERQDGGVLRRALNERRNNTQQDAAAKEVP